MSLSSLPLQPCLPALSPFVIAAFGVPGALSPGLADVKKGITLEYVQDRYPAPLVTGKIFGYNAKQARSIAKHYLVPVITAPALANVLQNEVNSYSPISTAYFQEVSLQPSLPFLSIFLFPFLS